MDLASTARSFALMPNSGRWQSAWSCRNAHDYRNIGPRPSIVAIRHSALSLLIRGRRTPITSSAQLCRQCACPCTDYPVLRTWGRWTDHPHRGISVRDCELSRHDDRIDVRRVRRTRGSGISPAYERLSLSVAGDEDILALLETVPAAKRQPNLLLGVVRFLGGPVDEPAAFHDFTVASWPAVEAGLRTRATQTNEAGRCALLLPVLASLPQPLALLEVGTAAGLGLYPDRYSYRYGGHLLGSSGPILDWPSPDGATNATTRGRMAGRTGPESARHHQSGDLAWLEALIWPEHSHRRGRLHAAAAIAAAHPPMLTRGDLTEELLPLAAQAPAGATLAVSTRPCCTRCRRRAERRSWTWYASCRDLDRGRGPGRPDLWDCRRHRTRHCTMCSHSTVCRWPGLAPTDRQWRGSRDRGDTGGDCPLGQERSPTPRRRKSTAPDPPVLHGSTSCQPECCRHAERRLRARPGGCLAPQYWHASAELDCMNIRACLAPTMRAHAALPTVTAVSGVGGRFGQRRDCRACLVDG